MVAGSGKNKLPLILTVDQLRLIRIAVREAMEKRELEGKPAEVAKLSGLLGELEQMDPDHYQREELDIRQILEGLDESEPS